MLDRNAFSTNEQLSADIVIVGGGLVGASLACSLAYHCADLHIVVLEAQPVPPPRSDIELNAARHTSYDTRGTALSYGTRQIYEQIGIWPQLARYANPIHTVHISDKNHLGNAQISKDEEGLDALGYVVENQCIGPILLQAIAAADNIQWYSPAVVKKLTKLADSTQVVVSGEAINATFDAQLVVICDGADSPLRNQLGISTDERSYHQHAIIANVSTSLPNNHVAYERFTDTGPMALLPLAEFNPGDNVGRSLYRSALVWTLPSGCVKEVLDLDDDSFLQRLQQRFGNRLGEFTCVGKRFNYPLSLVAATEQVRSGLVVMGNAAHSLHPVAGQGYNLAMRDVHWLSCVLANAAKNNEPLGSLTVLRRYINQQKVDQQRVLEFSDKVVKLFSNNNKILTLGRNLGLIALDLLPGIKPVFVRYAMGMHATI